jgi:hypothetical protein
VRGAELVIPFVETLNLINFPCSYKIIYICVKVWKNAKISKGKMEIPPTSSWHEN